MAEPIAWTPEALLAAKNAMARSDDGTIAWLAKHPRPRKER